MKKEYTAEEMAELIGISKRAINMRARNIGWETVLRPNPRGGGHVHLYPFSSLPADVKIKIIAAEKAASSPEAGNLTPSASSHSPLAPLPPARGDFSFPSGAAALPPEVASCATETERLVGLRNYMQAPPWKKQVADARLAILSHFEKYLERNFHRNKNKTEVIAEYCDLFNKGLIEVPAEVKEALTRGLSRPTLLRYRKAYETHDIGGLLPDYGNRAGATLLNKEMQTYVVGMIYERPHIKIEMIKNGLQARFNHGQRIPSYAAIRNYILSWKEKNRALLLDRTNPDKWRSAMQAAFGNRAAHIVRLNQEWEMDSTPADLLLNDGSRHTLIFNIDIYSRRVKILVSPTSKSIHVASLFRRALLDWGVPETVRTDNGSDYASKHMQRVWSALDIKVDLCPPFTPESKPFVERCIKTYLHDLFELLPGYVGHNINDRKAIEARKSFASRMMKKGECVELRMSAEELQTWTDRWLKAVYERNAHGGIEGKTPFQMAMEWTQPVRRVQDAHVLDILLAPVPGEKGDGMRTISTKGIRVENATYIAPELGAHIKKRALVLEDKTDFGKVHVFLDGKLDHYLCVAECPERTGISRAEVAKVARETQKAVMAEGRKELKKIARQAGVKQVAEEILRHREGEAASLSMLPHPGEEYLTSAIESAKRQMLAGSKKNEPIELTAEEEEAFLKVEAQAKAKAEAAAMEDQKIFDIAEKLENKRGVANWRKIPGNFERYEYLIQLEQSLARDGLALEPEMVKWLRHYETTSEYRAIYQTAAAKEN